MKEEKNKKKYLVLGILLALLIALGFLATLKIDTVIYEGNERLTVEELDEYFQVSGIKSNPIIYMINTWLDDKMEIPFVEEYEIELKSLHSIKVTIYEKSIVGYIDYMGTYMYFDKDGIVVESSLSKYEDVPQITGVKFDDIVLHEEIPVESKKIFSIILDVTQLVEKHNISVGRINISDDMSVTLYVKNFRVAMGNAGGYGEKMAALADIIPSMVDIPGELNMREYNNNNSGYVFKKD